MNSFAFWCRRNDKEEKTDDNPSVEAMVNINLWIAGDQGKRKGKPIAFDFGLMLSPCDPEKSENNSSLRKLSKRLCNNFHNDISVLDHIKGISLYCPFALESNCFSDLMPCLNKETLGAIFNDRCRVVERDFTSRYMEVNLANDENQKPFLLLSCDSIEIKRCGDGGASIINIDFPHRVRVAKDKPSRVYIRFRLLLGRNCGLVKRSDSHDKVFTSAFSREETIDLRINDYRTLNDEMRERIDGVAPDVYRLQGMTVHTLLMAQTNVTVESFEDLHEKRLLEGNGVWEKYAPKGSAVSNVVAWHWKKKIDKPGEGYKTYLKLSYSVCNWKTIILYIVFLIFFSVMTNSLTTLLCDELCIGSINVTISSAIICIVLIVLCFGKPKIGNQLKRIFKSIHDGIL